MIELIIVDDHPLILEGMQAILADHSDILIKGVANNGIKLLQLMESVTCDVIIMDINMPDMDGIETTKNIIRLFPDIKVIAFSQYDDKYFIRRILKAGAKGYLLKSTLPNEINTAIKQVYDGMIYLGKELPGLYKNQYPKKSMPLLSSITKREIEVLKKICQEKSTKEIAKELFISIHTVETHRSNLLVKIRAKNSAGLVKWALQNDLIQ